MFKLVLALVMLVAVGGDGLADTPSSSLRLESVIDSDSADAIVAELERAETLICVPCVALVLDLLDDPRYIVREAAAWWVARRPAHKRSVAAAANAALLGNDSEQARNAADILGAFLEPASVPLLATALQRTELSAEARSHITAALARLGHRDANPALSAAMADSNPEVRLAAVAAWVEIRGQIDAAPAIPLVADSEVAIRRKAAAVIGYVRDGGGRVALEERLASDDDAAVRRNAAWALGQIGDEQSRVALEEALLDPSGLVRMTARVALRKVRQ